ncbi:MAG: CCA tRNA nucleotidyltransferase [Clostridiales bacterium]|nr:CCA tRNA nucleotidyltransferase [Clostridiales bacterium]
MKLPEEVKFIISALRGRGFAAYAVGGCVRDSLLGLAPHDWDIATEAAPAAMREVFAGFPLLDTGERFGTLTLLLGKKPFELTTFRRESRYSDARHPDGVVFHDSLREDLSRRDFTVNALAFCEEEGLIDPFGGQKDLQNRLIRCVGRPEKRFGEDPLRILRAARFAFSLGFTIEPETRATMSRQKHLLSSLTAERVRDELCALLTKNKLNRPYLEIADLLRVLIPGLDECFSCPQDGGKPGFSVGEHLLAGVNQAEPLLPLRLAMLLHDVGKPRCPHNENGGFPGHAEISAAMAREILRGLKFPRSLSELAEQLILYHHAELPPQPPVLRKLLSQTGEENTRLLFAVREADLRAQRPPSPPPASLTEAGRVLRQILKDGDCFSAERLAINGDDLLGLGFAQGPRLGRLLAHLLGLVLENPELNSKERLLALAREEINH